MFSPPTDAAPQAATTRSSRRRQRPLSSGDSALQPKAKRQRSALTDQTFVAPDAPAEMQEIRATKSRSISSRRENTRSAQVPRRELAVRGKKQKLAERGSKSDGSVVLTRNDTYIVSRLPAWPDRLQADSNARQHGAIFSDTGYALALSQSHALVWPYSANTTSPETFTFVLPHATKNVSDPLPLGSLVSPSASSPEPGLVVVMPSTGKVTYWESITSATTMDLIQQQRNGVELTISGMLSGEAVVQILNAEPAGFVLGFSSGRLAYMNVRDGQGRPTVSVQFLRGASGIGGGGIFGSLRNVLSSSSWRGDLAAARAGPASPQKLGERDIVTATSKGRLQAWNLHRGGHYSLKAEAEARESIVLAMKETNPSLTSLTLETFELLDIAFTPTPVSSNELAAGDAGAHLLLLTSLSGRGESHYALVHARLKADSLEIGMIRHIRSYTTSVNHRATSKPRLHLPNPALVAFVIFDRAVIVASMAQQPDSPESQLLADRYLRPESFEDVVDFRADSGVEVTGSGMEEPYQAPPHSAEDSKSRRYRAKVPAAVLLVRGGGIIRVAATDPYKLTGGAAPQVTAKSKLEQAVFFGTQENNPLDFRGRAELQFTAEEVGAAALTLSHEILSCTTTYIPSLPASIDENLRRRAEALQNLVARLNEMNVKLDRLTRWKLLWDAEKVAGATVIWNRYDESLREKPIGQKHGLLTEIVEYIHEDFKTEPVAEAGELDRARYWFIHDIWRLEIAVPWAYQAVKISYREGQKDHAAIMRFISEADDFVSGALEGAFSFREANLGFYGLQNEELENGVLKTGYDALPEFWTSTHLVSETTRKLTDLAFSLVKEYWQKASGEGFPDSDLVNKVRKENVQLVDLCSRSMTERFRWLLAQEDRNSRSEGDQLPSNQVGGEAQSLFDFGGAGAEELGQANDALHAMIAHGEDEAKIKEVSQHVVLLTARFEDYYKLFGASFANALYKYYVSRGELFALLHDNDEHQQYLTNFLRSKPEFAKVAWIHEVSREKDFDRAAKSLLDLGLRRERDLWSKKVELSIGKLARLAGKSYSEAGGLLIPDGGHAELSETKKQLALIKIQDKVFAHIYPAISVAIDEKAELQLALEVYGNSSLAGKEAFSRMLEENMGLLVGHQTLDALSLIDLLTLMGENTRPEEQGLIDGEEFYLALQALESGPSDKDERGLTERVIWRRCMLRDDWREINNTILKDDQEISYQLRRTALYLTLRACFKNRMFEKPSTLAPVSPRGALGAYAEELDDRFQGLDADIKVPLLKDMQAEDESLRHYIEKCRLDKWFEGAFDLAKRDLQEEMDGEMEEGVAMKEMAKQVHEREQKVASDGRSAAMDILSSKPRYKAKTKLNGSVGGFRSSIVR